MHTHVLVWVGTCEADTWLIALTVPSDEQGGGGAACLRDGVVVLGGEVLAGGNGRSCRHCHGGTYQHAHTRGERQERHPTPCCNLGGGAAVLCKMGGADQRVCLLFVVYV